MGINRACPHFIPLPECVEFGSIVLEIPRVFLLYGNLNNIMRISFLVLLLLVATSCFAEEVDKTVRSLGLTKADLQAIWHAGRCDPAWSVTVAPKMLQNKSLLGYKGLSAGFFKQENVAGGVKLSPGKKCVALNRYYFQSARSKPISNFVARDKQFIAKYGYSVLDAIYVEHTQFYTFNGRVGNFRLRYAKELARKGLFTFVKKASTFNGKPSVAFSGRRTAKGNRFHDQVFHHSM